MLEGPSFVTSDMQNPKINKKSLKFFRSLTRTSVTKDLKKEVKKNSDIFLSTLNIQPTDAALFINGQFFDMDFTDMFTILDTIRSEERVLGGLGSLGLDSKQIQYLMNLNLVNKQQTQYGVDIRYVYELCLLFLTAGEPF